MALDRVEGFGGAFQVCTVAWSRPGFDAWRVRIAWVVLCPARGRSMPQP